LKLRALTDETVEKIRGQKKVAHLSYRPDPANRSVSILEVRLIEHESALPLVIEALVSSGASILDCSHFEVPLEEVFAEVVGRKGENT